MDSITTLTTANADKKNASKEDRGADNINTKMRSSPEIKKATNGNPFSLTHRLSKRVLEENRILAHLPRNKEADIYRLLRTQVLQAMEKKQHQSLAITSANYGEGKTTTAINLAISIAMDLKQTALLVDLDLRKPSTAQYLGIDAKYGLTDYLLGDIDIHETMIRLPFERLAIIPSGYMADNSSEIIGSPKMAALAFELKNRYPDRFIIYDMPPILAQDDPLSFLPHTDAALLVVKEGYTRQDDIKRCQDMLKGTDLLGTVLNDCV